MSEVAQGWTAAGGSTLSAHDASGASENAGRLLTAADVARLLCVPSSWVYAEARAGRIPHLRLGRYVRFRREAVLGWAESLERGAGAR